MTHKKRPNDRLQRRLGLALLALATLGAMPANAFAENSCENKKWEGTGWVNAVSNQSVPHQMGADYTKYISHPGYYSDYDCIEYDNWQCENKTWQPVSFRIIRNDGYLDSSGKTATVGNSMGQNAHKCPETH